MSSAVKHTLLSSAACALLITACSPAAGPTDPIASDKADCPECDGVQELHFVDWKARWALSMLSGADELSQHRLGTYSEDTFRAGEFKDQLVDHDTLVRQCENRAYSVSRDTGVSMFRDLADANTILEGIEGYRAELIDEVVADPENLAVFASLWDESAGGDASDCAYADFYVFRPDRTIANFIFDYRTGEVELLALLDSAMLQYPNAADFELVMRMDQYGGNGGSAVGTYDLETFSEEKLLEQIAAYDLNMGGCIDRRIETSTEGVTDAFDDFAADEMLSPFVQSDYNEDPASSAEHDEFRAALADEQNLLVISSTYKDNSTDYSEGCLYFDFYALRADGTAWRFTVSHTD
jgi:hypothetical protein